MHPEEAEFIDDYMIGVRNGAVIGLSLGFLILCAAVAFALWQ